MADDRCCSYIHTHYIRHFALNDRPGYKDGIPYVVQLRISFGFKGTIISSLMRAIPAVIWYGIQRWIGATALNEILKIFTDSAFDSIAICFVTLQAVQIGLSLYGFTAIKWIESVASIVMATVATNMVANIIPPTYVIMLITKARYKVAVTATGLLAIGAFPWLLVQEDNSRGLDIFILIYSAFLGPIVAILLVEYYILRKQKTNLKELYKKDGLYAGYSMAAMTSLGIGAAVAFIQFDLAWIIGFIVAGISYILLSKFAFKGSRFKEGTIYEEK